jgi:hypothetical protein
MGRAPHLQQRGSLRPSDNWTAPNLAHRTQDRRVLRRSHMNECVQAMEANDDDPCDGPRLGWVAR